MDNQHKLIKGYRDLSQAEIDDINRCKKLADDVGSLIKSLEHDDFIDQRWLSIAKTQLQQGFMALIRSIAKPDSF